MLDICRPSSRRLTVRSKNSVTTLLAFPVGIISGYPYEVVERQIDPGDIFTLITDGVDEAMDPDGNLYSKERVVKFIENGSTDPEQLGKDMLADVRSHANGHAQNDDITIMVFGRPQQ